MATTVAGPSGAWGAVNGGTPTMVTKTSRLSAALVALAMLGAGLVVALAATPAHAGWTNASGMTHYRICKEATPSANGWIFVSRVRKRAGTEDARAGIALFHDGDRRQRWSSGWLDDGERERGRVRNKRSGQLRIHVWQEAGDLESNLGTALQAEVFRARDIERCG